LVELSLLAQTLGNFMKINVNALGHRKKGLNEFSREASLISFIKFYHGWWPKYWAAPFILFYQI